MNDETTDSEKKSKLAALADNLVATLEVVVKRTEEQMDSSSKLIQDIVAQAAEPNGEFVLPLTAVRVSAMRSRVQKSLDGINDGLISTVFSYMKKANDDGLDGMVVILQKFLQIWASCDLLSVSSVDASVTTLLEAEAEQWDGIIKDLISGPNPTVDKESLVAAIQSCVERAVLQKPSGSPSQRVQAEFLRELIGRVRAAPGPAP
jgi:hypothetical protein